MDLLSDPVIKETYDKCKLTVKQWELGFKKKNNRLPSKWDIKEASSEVKYAYKKYYELKASALEQSMQGIDGFDSEPEEPEPEKEPENNLNQSNTLEKIDDNVWGEHLNNPKAEKKPEPEKKTVLNESITKKLFVGSKFTKRNPRKSLSFSCRKKSDVFDTSQTSQSFSLSQPAEPENDIDLSKFAVKQQKLPEKIQVNPVNILSLCEKNTQKTFKNIDSGWIERLAEQVGLELKDEEKEKLKANETKQEDSDEDIIEASDEESNSTPSKPLTILSAKPVIEPIIPPKPEIESDEELHRPKKAKTEPKPKPNKNLRRSERGNKLKASLLESDDEKEPYNCSSEEDPDFIQEREEKQQTKPKPKPKAKKAKKKVLPSTNFALEDIETETIPTEDYDYDMDLRIVAPRKPLLETLKESQTSTSTPVKDKKAQALERLEKKAETMNLNENFIRINLKKKTFSRGKKTFNYSKYKKAQWKEKKALCGPNMYIGGCDGVPQTCFNCNQTGHFAQNCPSNKSQALLPLEAVDTEEPSPLSTLQQAAIQQNKPKLTPDQQVELKVKKIQEDIQEIIKTKPTASKETIPPYYSNQFTATEEVLKALKLFGHDSFRPGQEKAIMRILSGQSTLVTLSTGSGKSLCYQLPAYLYCKANQCIVLVISPLVSLMEDQVKNMPPSIKAACLHSNQNHEQRKEIIKVVSTGLINILLISPEAIVAGERTTSMSSLFRQLPPIAFACIDEAHCLSQWSHNFRPSYLMVSRILRETLKVHTILALTATATASTRKAIIEQIQIPDGLNGVIGEKAVPDNLILTVSKDENRDKALLELLYTDRFAQCQSIIIYCIRREECNRLASFLRTSLPQTEGKKRKRASYQVEAYHAGLAFSKRKTIQNAFMSGSLRIVIATIAFGMGINKSDIRAVIHYNMPKSFESYVQEIGRAGRDGLTAHCHLFLDCQGNDERELRRFIHASSSDRHIIRKLLKKVFVGCSCPKSEVCPKHEVAFSVDKTVQDLDISEETISTLLCYLELSPEKYVQVLPKAYTSCKVVSYSGFEAIKAAAEKCPPLSLALNGQTEGTVLTFPIVDIASQLGIDSGTCKHLLKQLEWKDGKRTLLSVDFEDLGFRLLVAGNLNEELYDRALDELYGAVVQEEEKQLLQLHALHECLLQVAKLSYKQCLEGSQELKDLVRNYFESEKPLEQYRYEKGTIVNERSLLEDIRVLVRRYSETSFTGRAIARIFYGIHSPNFPASMWGQCKFWRSHIKDDFNEICRIASNELFNLRMN